MRKPINPITLDVTPADREHVFPSGFAEARIRKYPGLFEFLEERENESIPETKRE